MNGGGGPTSAEVRGRHVEPRVAEVLDRKLVNRPTGPYAARTDVEVEAALHRLMAAEGLKDVLIGGLKRLAGGASKEQFAFTLSHGGASGSERMVLRMDPLESIAETCRLREAQVLRAMQGIVPVPAVRFVDPEGVHLGQPGAITSFVEGVTKPTAISATGVSGIGLRYGIWADLLAPQFVENLVAIHNADLQAMDLSSFAKPAAGTREAALFQVGWWARVWHEDHSESVPIVTLTERWLRENAPVCAAPCLVHADYRIGNFMFEEPSGRFVAVLDWELAHVGDFHEDLAWVVQRLFGTIEDDGTFMVCGLLPREKFLAQYQALSGRTVDPATLHYYEVLNAWKCSVLNQGPAVRAAMAGNNHQDLLLTWLSGSSAVFHAQLVDLLKER